MNIKHLILASLSFFILTACGQSSNSDQTTIRIGSKGSDAEIWSFIAESPAAEEAGLAITVEDITEGPQLNQATADGEIDVNAFQNFGYMNEFNADSSTQALAAIGTTYLEPFGLYSKLHDDLEDLPDGASIGLADYPSDQARGLQLLEANGLISLAKDIEGEPSIADIVDNPKNLQFEEMNENTLPRVLEDMDGAVFGNTIAMEAGLNVFEDTLVYEEVSEDNDQAVNILVTVQGREDEAALQSLLDLYHTEEVQDFIHEKFAGTKVPVRMDQEAIDRATLSAS